MAAIGRNFGLKKNCSYYFKFPFIYLIKLKWFELRQYFFTLQVSTLPAILPPPLSQLPDRPHHLPPPKYSHQDVYLGAIRQTAMRYGKIRFHLWRVAVVTQDSTVNTGFTDSHLQRQKH